MEYSGAYNPLYIINKNRGSLDYDNAIPFKNIPYGWEIKATKRPIGIAHGREEIPFKNHKIQLERGDFICIFSDGYADQFGGEKESKYTYGRMKEVLVTNSHKSMDEMNYVLMQNLEDWKGVNQQTDDICIIGIKL